MKVLLSVYSIQVIRNKEAQLLSKFGGNVDFLKFFKKFLRDLFKEPKHYERPKQHTLSLGCPSLKNTVMNLEDRNLYGYFEAGRDGDDLKVRNFKKENHKKFRRISKEESTMRAAFFYLSVPKNTNRAYLVLQVPEGQGIKHLLTYLLSDFKNREGLQHYHFELGNIFNEAVFHKMLDKGLLKELTFTKYGIPNYTEGFNNSESKPDIGRGSVKTIYQSGELGENFKEYVREKFKMSKKKKPGDERTILEFNGFQADELSIKLDYMDKQKTYFIQNYQRTLPDVDVTDDVIDGKNQIVLDKIVLEAKNLIAETNFQATPDDLQD